MISKLLFMFTTVRKVSPRENRMTGILKGFPIIIKPFLERALIRVWIAIKPLLMIKGMVLVASIKSLGAFKMCKGTILHKALPVLD